MTLTCPVVRRTFPINLKEKKMDDDSSCIPSQATGYTPNVFSSLCFAAQLIKASL